MLLTPPNIFGAIKGTKFNGEDFIDSLKKFKEIVVVVKTLSKKVKEIKNNFIVIICKEDKERIISRQTSQKISHLLRKVVEEGTGKHAKIKNLDIGGKTGTAKKSNKIGGYYEDKVITSFLGVFPINKPKYLLLVLFDEPIKGLNSLTPYGSNTAAPIFAKIVNQIAPILNLKKE